MQLGPASDEVRSTTRMPLRGAKAHRRDPSELCRIRIEPVKLGMNMLLWSTDVSGTEYDAVFAMLKDAGFDGVEIPIFDREVDKYAELGRRLDALGLEALAVRRAARTTTRSRADPGVASRGVAATKANLDSAAALGAPLDLRPARRAARRLLRRGADGGGEGAHRRVPARRSRRTRRSAASRSRSST